MVCIALGGGWQSRKDNDYIPIKTKIEIQGRTAWGDLLGKEESPG
jgi:hypothetical protein